MPGVIEIQAPSRLHFGMLSFGQPAVRRFGGVGVMVDQPGTTVRAMRADRFAAAGTDCERAAEFARRVAKSWGETLSVDVKVEPHQP